MAKNLFAHGSYKYISKSKYSVFCALCMLFEEGGESNASSFTKEGFDDWKNAHHPISEHENSMGHKQRALTLKERAKEPISSEELIMN